MYKKFQIDTTLIKNRSILIDPTTSYLENLPTPIFNIKGQFETPGTMFEPHTTSDTTVIIQSEIIYQGEKSAAIYLDNQNTYCYVTNIDPLELTNNTFLELDFLSSINFNIGLIIINAGITDQKEELIQLYATEEWKKIYLDLGPLINMGNNSSTFKIYFEGSHNQTEDKSTIYFDNLKLVYL